MIEHPLPHFSKRPKGATPSAIILHDTAGKTARSALDHGAVAEVSWHYLVDKGGDVYRCVGEEMKAWHAGKSELFGADDVNAFSLGVEIVDDNDADPYPDPQMAALIELVSGMCWRHRIPLNRVVGHEHVAPGRKVDPGRDFPWFEFLAAVGSHLGEKLS